MPDPMIANTRSKAHRGRPNVPDAAQRVLTVLWLVYTFAMLGVSVLPSELIPRFLLLGWDKVADVIAYIAALFADDTVHTYPIIGWDKIAHAAAFLGLGALTVPVVLHHKHWIVLTLAYGLAIGLLTEWLQSFIPSRTASVADVVADLVGTCIAVLVSILWLRLFSSAFTSEAKQART